MCIASVSFCVASLADSYDEFAFVLGAYFGVSTRVLGEFFRTSASSVTFNLNRLASLKLCWVRFLKLFHLSIPFAHPLCSGVKILLKYMQNLSIKQQAFRLSAVGPDNMAGLTFTFIG